MAEMVRWLRSLLPSEEAQPPRCWRPAVDVYQLRTGWLIKCDLAGVRPEDVVVTLHGRELTIQGVRRDCRVEQDCCHYLMEIAYSRFERTLLLPETLAAARVTVAQDLGMLLVRIEKEIAE
jgi:HSP20 family protein